MPRTHAPIPRNLRSVIGSIPKKRPTDPAQPIAEPKVSIPAAPDFLTTDESEVFERMARKFEAMRVMTDVDVDALVIFARNSIDAREAHERLLETGLVVRSPDGGAEVSPWFAIRNGAEARLLRVLREFGLRQPNSVQAAR